MCTLKLFPHLLLTSTCFLKLCSWKYNIKISRFENGALFSFYGNGPLDDEDIRTQNLAFQKKGGLKEKLDRNWNVALNYIEFDYRCVFLPLRLH